MQAATPAAINQLTSEDSMTTLHGKEIKEGDKVWDVRHGWELVRIINENNKSPILIKNTYYSETGKLYHSDLHPSIYWEEMILTPKPEPVYEWQWLYWSEHDYYKTSIYYSSEGEFKKNLPFVFTNKSRPPIRIEESKREVKP